MAEDQRLEKLREPFPPGTVGILPKPYKKDSPKGKCDVCSGYHGLPAAHLDFVGHAAVTDRLLSVDPEWTWEPLSLDASGLPALDREGNLWIRLTVCGVTRLGVGDGPSMKERIGDALRNAAMRFGVALDLWAKDGLESGHSEDKATNVLPANGNGSTTNRRAQGTVRRAPQPAHDPETGELKEPSKGKPQPRYDESLEKLSEGKVRRLWAISRGRDVDANLAALHLFGVNAEELDWKSGTWLTEAIEGGWKLPDAVTESASSQPTGEEPF